MDLGTLLVEQLSHTAQGMQGPTTLARLQAAAIGGWAHRAAAQHQAVDTCWHQHVYCGGEEADCTLDVHVVRLVVMYVPGCFLMPHVACLSLMPFSDDLSSLPVTASHHVRFVSVAQ
jgi:hypothetical protein